MSISIPNLLTEITNLLKEEEELNASLNGLAIKKNFTEKDADPEQLAMGIKVEFEHTDDPEIAKKIALDHLAEHPKYYSALADMEAQLGISSGDLK